MLKSAGGYYWPVFRAVLLSEHVQIFTSAPDRFLQGKGQGCLQHFGHLAGNGSQRPYFGF